MIQASMARTGVENTTADGTLESSTSSLSCGEKARGWGRAEGYADLDGQALRYGDRRPSRAALESRWAAFRSRRGAR